MFFGSGSLVDFWTVSAWQRRQIFCGVALIWRDRPAVAGERFRRSRPLKAFIEKLLGCDFFKDRGKSVRKKGGESRENGAEFGWRIGDFNGK